jgi:cobalt-zinc-cadmium efflux system protein
MHAWTITSGINIFSTHIEINDFTNAQDSLRGSTNILKEKFNLYLLTIQMEKECLEVEDKARYRYIKSRKEGKQHIAESYFIMYYKLVYRIC